MIYLIFIGCTLVWGGCSDDGSDNTVSGDTATSSGADTGASSGGDTAGGACSVQSPCSAGLVCDPATSVCVERCTVGACASGQACDLASGLCVEGAGCSAQSPCSDAVNTCNQCRGLCVPTDGKRACTEQSNCFSDQYCDACTGLCEQRQALCDPCIHDNECAQTGDRCIDLVSATGGRFCGQACETILDCPAGYECPTALKQCVPSSGDCASPASCADDSACRGSNQICERGRCVPGCTDSGACPTAKVCEYGRCLDACPSRACEGALVCDTASGICEANGECRDSKDCPLPQTYCDATSRQCVAGCQVDDDCQDAYQECDAGQCKPRGCTYAGSCAFEQVCDTASGLCQAATGPHCDTCDPNTQGACGPEANKCLELKDDQDQSLGNFCFVACSSDPNNRCPQGYQCAPLQDQDGNPAGEVCFRDCTYDPWAD